MRSLRAVTAGVVVVMCVSCTGEGDLSKEEAAAVAIYDAIDWRRSEEPDVVLLAARTAAHLTAMNGHNARNDLERQLQRLMDLRIQGQDRGWGWGLSHSWDAFSDGTTNPADTIYSYTTAAAALAFLDGYEVLGDDQYLVAAQRAAHTLLHDTCCWRRNGHLSVWYSNQPSDQSEAKVVYNVNGLTLGVLSRLDKHMTSPRYEEERTAIAAHLIDNQGTGYSKEPIDGVQVSPANWPYMRGRDRPNDLIHETFIVEGLLAHGTSESLRAARASLDGIATSHFDEDGRPYEGRHTFGSLGWGPGAGLFALASSDAHRDRAEEVARQVAETVTDAGRTSLAEEDEPRAQAWYALGLARHANPSGPVDP